VGLEDARIVDALSTETATGTEVLSIVDSWGLGRRSGALARTPRKAERLLRVPRVWPVSRSGLRLVRDRFVSTSMCGFRFRYTFIPSSIQRDEPQRTSTQRSRSWSSDPAALPASSTSDGGLRSLARRAVRRTPRWFARSSEQCEGRRRFAPTYGSPGEQTPRRGRAAFQRTSRSLNGSPAEPIDRVEPRRACTWVARRSMWRRNRR
jgi:hypothetical protein